VVQQLAPSCNATSNTLISTPFSQEIIDYIGLLGDLELNEDDLFTHPIRFSLDQEQGKAFPGKAFCQYEANSREHWFLQKGNITLFHDRLLENMEGVQSFQNLLQESDAVFRVVDLHQIGHEKTRLSSLPIHTDLSKVVDKLGYIGMGAARLLKGDQLVDAFKSYSALNHAPGFGPRPILLGDGEDFLNSLMWLGSTLQHDKVADEIKAMEVLHRNQEEFIEGRENFVRSLFQQIKEFRREQQYQL
jgi:hypothetical protein